MKRALMLASTPGVPLGPNPRVGCVILTLDGQPIAEGFHRGAGTPHAEVAALREAGRAAQSATAVVTLEPCNHTGRTGPCTEALIEAGISRVVFAQPDPNPIASGGTKRLGEAGIEVAFGLHEDQARRLNRAWTFALEHHRPFVTWKYAASIDGRSAAADGTSKWITSPPARIDVHRHRALCDVIMVGTNTVVLDDPRLTVRDEFDQPLPDQPLRVVVGRRELPETMAVFDDSAPTERLRTNEPVEALAQLYDQGRRHVFLEGGPNLAASFLKAGLIDEVIAYVAPKFLGAGAHAVGDLGINNVELAIEFQIVDAQLIGTGPDTNLRVTMQRGR
ncbi:MAG: bifunctional diaminohydroxyphosphoribosylaminopyrimidine deaminase/5-amino-6-(5-phosphoribosylamino)uracil reductase RibD [Nocardioidaceae bacterium]